MKSRRFVFYSLLKLSLFFLIASLAGLSSIYSYEKYITLLYLPTLFLFFCSLNNYKFTSIFDPYSRIYLSIILLSLFLLFVSVNLETASDNIIRLGGVYISILLTLEIINFKNGYLIKYLLLSFVSAFYVLSFYLFTGLEQRIDFDSQWIDRSQFDLNANVYSYFSYFSNIALFYLIELTRKKIFLLLSWLTLAMGVTVAFTTVSRSGLVFTILVGLIYHLFIYKPNRPNFIRTLFIIISFVACFQVVYGIYVSSYLKARVENSIEVGDGRQELTKDAINVFLTYPFTGVGPGQFYNYASHKGSFSHNSYTEIASTLGIVGITLLIVLYFRPFLISCFTWFSSYSFKSLLKLNVLFFGSFLLINNIYVFYLTTYGMIFFFLILSIQKRILNGQT